MQNRNRTLTAGRDDQDRRTDRVLRKYFPHIPLSGIYKALRKGRITVNGAKVPPAHRIQEGDKIALDPSLAREGAGKKASPPEDPSATLPEDWVLCRGRDIITLNKPAGIDVHGKDSIAERIQATPGIQSTDSLSFTAAPLHRLDRNTSGLLAIGATLRGAQLFSGMLREHRFAKLYLALLEGHLDEMQSWTNYLEKRGRQVVPSENRENSKGRLARMEAIPLKQGRLSGSGGKVIQNGGATLCLMILHTGITHQIRAQASLNGYPLRGDPRYNPSADPHKSRYALHALGIRMKEGEALSQEERAVLAPVLNQQAPLPQGFIDRVGPLFPTADRETLAEKIGILAANHFLS